MPKYKTFRSFDELADEFDTRRKDSLQVLIRISNTWKHRAVPDFNVTLLGLTLRYYKSTRSLGARLSIIGINFNLSIHTQRQ